eukprot:gnl/MRDRNA2_/MRDRNA2_52796_c0_seq1.p1 gnl/MRDRNA2_/MRDRNA2_52796_c0~~gnl/MRDRNA2_/MRDRNA2_52796_c0_seq1.p1  ORF type:complete len:277 (+),score=62.90 gnl/MRDRNA2_/MRDRNA2_52796_c0_seq1:91-921(+)
MVAELQRIDPAQPPLEVSWARDWLNLAQVRLRSGKADVAAAAAGVAAQLDSNLEKEAAAVLHSIEMAKLHHVVVNSRGVLLLEIMTAERTASGERQQEASIVWSGGDAFARALHQLADWTGKRILELGSGTGVAGLAAALSGAKVTVTDLHDALPLLQRNVERNSVAIHQQSGTAVAYSLDWRDDLNFMTEEPWDLVLCSDLIWHKEHCEPLTRWLVKIQVPCLFIYKPRHPGVRVALHDSWSAHGITVQPLEIVDVDIGDCEFCYLHMPAGVSQT